MVLAMTFNGNPLIFLLFDFFLSQFFLLEYSVCDTMNFMDFLILVDDIALYILIGLVSCMLRFSSFGDQQSVIQESLISDAINK